MAYYRTETYSTTGTKGSWNLDPSIVPFNAAIACTLTGSGTYSLQWTMNLLDDPTATDSSASWFTSPDIPIGTAASAVTAFVTPVGRVRLVIASLSGTIQMQMRQGFSTN